MKVQVYILLFLLFTSCKTKESSDLFTSSNFELLELAEGVYACIHIPGGKAICNVGIVDNGKETIIFDSFLSPEAAQELPQVVKHYNLSPIKYVINSHYHNDHIRGNQVFSDEVKIISTTRTAQLIESQEPIEISDEKEYALAELAYYDSLYRSYEGNPLDIAYQKIIMWRSYYEILSWSHQEITTTVPDVLIDEVVYLNGPDRKVKLLSRGKGHTDSDMVLYLPGDGILFAGDLIFNKSHPYLAHGSLHEWKTWLSYLTQLKPLTVIPGHGTPGDSSTIQSMKTYIEDIEKLAAQIDDPGNFSTVLIPTKYSDWWFDRFFPVNLKFAYEQKFPVLGVLFQELKYEIKSHPHPDQLILSDNYHYLITDPGFRPKVREALKNNAKKNRATMVRNDEPGKRISMVCRILDEDTNQPLQKVAVELVHTDIHGLYFTEMGMWNPRIFAYLITDESGEIEINTIMPGKYSGDEQSLGASHIHFTFEKKEYRTYAAEFVFEDDPVFKKTGNSEGLPVAKSTGDLKYEVIIKMQKNREE